MIVIDEAIRVGVSGTMKQIGNAYLTLQRELSAELPPRRIVAAQGANARRPAFLADLPGAVRSEHGAS